MGGGEEDGGGGGSDDPHIPSTHEGLLKWKYPSKNPVDFLFEGDGLVLPYLGLGPNKLMSCLLATKFGLCMVVVVPSVGASNRATGGQSVRSTRIPHCSVVYIVLPPRRQALPEEDEQPFEEHFEGGIIHDEIVEFAVATMR
ncbi:mRNA capping enzyme, C-terminal domain, partial [Musa troglodytarum]